MITVNAPAKVNLTLHVGAVRSDGYHNIDTVLVPLAFHDTLVLSTRPDGLAIRGMDLPQEENSVTLVYNALRALCPGLPGATVTIEKRIPLASGLGGESADAVAAIQGFTRLFSLALTPTDLTRLARAAGSDAVALIHGGPVRLTGRDESVRSLSLHHRHELLILLPKAHPACLTKDIYASFRGESTENPTDAVIAALSSGDDEALYARLSNDLERDHPLAPLLYRAREALAPCGVERVILAGSGAAFAAFGHDLSRVRTSRFASETFSMIQTAF